MWPRQRVYRSVEGSLDPIVVTVVDVTVVGDFGCEIVDSPRRLL